MSDSVIAYDSKLYEILDKNTPIKRVATGFSHTEGPVYFPEENSLYFSDVSGNKLLRWHEDSGVTIIREPSHYQNGNCRDLDGRLVSCSHGQRSLIRREKDGQWTLLVSHYQGDRLNSPNDVVVKSDGTFWFTDPPFGLTQPGEGYGGDQEQPGSFVYCFNPETGEIKAVITEMERPNGLAFNPDETILYVSDTSQVNYSQGHHYIRAYDIDANAQATNSRVFAVIEPGQPDGLKVDQNGHIFTSSADSIQIYTPDGQRLGKILVPEVCANLAFGGPDQNQLFITAGTSLYTFNLLLD